MINLLNKLLIPFAIIHVRIIQFRYKRITTRNEGNHTNQNISELQLLQSKEYYYKRSFSTWGRFHPSFHFSHKGMIRHIKFMNWLFPEKDFKEWDIVIWHNPEAVTYYHNRIFNLLHGVSPIYEKEILKQIKEWKDKYEKRYLK